MAKKIFITIGVIAVIAIGVIFGLKKADNGYPIKVGVLLPMTGDMALYGTAINNGIKLALEKSPIKDKIMIITEDDRGNTKTSTTTFNKLLADKVDVVIGGAMSSSAAAIAPIAQKEKVTLISPTATLPSLSNVGEYFFRLWPSDNYDGQIIADFAYNSLEIKNIAVLYVNLDYGVGIKNVFCTDFEEFGGNTVFCEGFSQGTTDFKSQLKKIKESKAQALFIPGYYQEIANILKQLKELNIKIKILGVNSLYDERLIQLADEQAEGIIFTYPSYDVESENGYVQKFVEDYFDKYGTKPDAFAAQGYDCMNVIEYAINNLIEKNSIISRENIKNEIANIKNFNGVSGKFSFDKNGDVIKDLKFITVKNGKFIHYEME
jgi:branched-chain amino acid transport system substrate-binding protein